MNREIKLQDNGDFYISNLPGNIYKNYVDEYDFCIDWDYLSQFEPWFKYENNWGGNTMFDNHF